MQSVSEKILSKYIYDSERCIWTVPDQSGDFTYSDGDEVEQRLLHIVSTASDLGSTSVELRNKITDWPSQYHLSPRRSNLLRPLSAMLHGRILEIGAGCGAITRFLGETGSDIIAVEGSRRRATVAASRCRDLKNVAVLADAFHNVPEAPEFDVVTLIGVLEYARIYFPSVSIDPVDAMLMHARRFLRPGGILIVAIENQLGLKYFAGYGEDHVGLSMFGIEDRYSVESVVTFGRRELKNRIAATGLNQQQYWFPFPDYKLPVSLLSDRLLELDIDIDVSPILSNSVFYDPQAPDFLGFSLEQAWQPVVRNKLFGELANSFLVVASDSKLNYPNDNVLAYHYAVERRPEFAKEVSFELINDCVMTCKRLLFPHIKSPSDLPISIVLKDEPYLPGTQWHNYLIRIVNTPGWSYSDLEEWAEVWFTAFIAEAGLTVDRHQLTANYIVSGSFIDTVPRNLIISNKSEPRFFDQEWQLAPSIEIGYVLFRGIFRSLTTIRSFAEPAPNTSTKIIDLFTKTSRSLGITVTDEDILNYVEIESNIEKWVSNCSWTTLGSLQQVFPVRHQIKSDFHWREALSHLKHHIQDKDTYIRALTDSWCWRITAPLRKIVGLFKRDK